MGRRAIYAGKSHQAVRGRADAERRQQRRRRALVGRARLGAGGGLEPEPGADPGARTVSPAESGIAEHEAIDERGDDDAPSDDESSASPRSTAAESSGASGAAAAGSPPLAAAPAPQLPLHSDGLRERAAAPAASGGPTTATHTRQQRTGLHC